MNADGNILPLSGAADLSTITILADGEEIALTIQVMSVTVIHEINRIPTAKLVLLDGDVSKQDFEVSNEDTFAPGTEIEIQSGYHNNEDPIFKGLVVRHGLRTKAEGPSVLTVVCKDAAAKMTVGCNSAYFYDSTDSDVLEEIIGKNGLGADVEATTVTHENIVQYQCSDWDFLLMRAELAGMLVFVKSGTVAIKKPDPAQGSKQTFVYGATLINFEVEVDAEHQFQATSTAGWDQSTQDLVETEGSDPGFPEQGDLEAATLAEVLAPKDYHLHHTGNVGEGELQAWSDSLFVRSRLAKIRGRLTCQGFAEVDVGDVIELDGVGERFKGNAFIGAIRHDITQGNWLAHMEIGVDPKWFHAKAKAEQPLAGGMLPAVEGLHIGVVTALEGDPMSDHRIRVRLPLIDSTEDGIWTRICTLDAGDGRGTVFRPEIGDEVIVGFLYGDPRQAIMLGMLHSSKLPAHIEPSDDNHQKAYMSRAGTELMFDDEKPACHIKLDSGRIVELDDDAGTIICKDPDGNTITLCSDGITLDSPKDITLKAGGDIKMEGINIEAKASAEFKADGGAGSKLTSGAVTTVKGSAVMIN